MKIALAPLQLTPSIDDNLQLALDAIEKAANAQVDAICFPEIQLSPFFPQHSKTGVKQYLVSLDSEYVKQLQAHCAKYKIVGFPNVYLKHNEQAFDATLVIEKDGSLVGISKMVHIAQVPCFYEQDYYTPSDSGFITHPTSVGDIGVVVCFDRHFPESIRTCVLQGAKLIVIPTANTKHEDTQMFEWEMRVAAMQNNVFIAMCNRTGLEDQMDFCGESIVIGPSGEVIKKSTDEPDLLIADCDLQLVNQVRARTPYLALRRPDCYAD